MQHSYVTTVDIYGKPILGGNALKTRKGDSTSEALQLRQANAMCSKINVRNFESMQHSTQDRKLLKNIRKKVKLDKSFRNEKVLHYKAA